MTNVGNKVKNLIIVLLSTAIGVALGCVLLWIVSADYVAKALWIMFLVLGILISISSLPGLITAIKNIKQKHGVLNLVLSSVSMALGLMMIFAQQYIAWLVAIYLLVFPIIRIVLAKDHFAQTCEEAFLLVLGIVVLVFGVGGATSIVFTVAAWIIIGLSAIYGILGLISALKS